MKALADFFPYLEGSLQGLFLLVKNMKKLPKIQLSQKPTYIVFSETQDFCALFGAIEKKFNSCFLFESLGEKEKFSRYSIIGFNPEHIISARGNSLIIDGVTYQVENPYLTLRDLMPAAPIARNYSGGLVGYLNYDAVNYMEPSLKVKVHKDFDPFMFGVYTDGLIFDKLTNQITYFYYHTDRSGIVKKIMHTRSGKSTFQVNRIADGLTRKQHADVVNRVKNRIRAGDTFQCEVGFKTKYTVDGDTFRIYENLRKINPSPFMYYLKFGDKKIIGASPELLFSLRDGEMTTKPLAGTIRRGINPKEDKKLAHTLLSDPKEKAEHIMLVDLHRNDIGRVARFGTVKIRDFMSVKKFSHVQHISSEIVGLIRPGDDMFSSFAANFPAGTLTGAPKIESMKIIDANEPEARGPYGGAVGHFGFNGDCTFAINIRSLYVSGKTAYTQTSGGIVYDSLANREYTEIQRKLAAMQKTLGL